MTINAARVILVLFSVAVSLSSSQEFAIYGTCIAQNGEVAVCIPLNHCTVIANMVVKRRLTDEEKLLAQKSQCGYNKGVVLICCPESYRTETPNTTDTTDTTNEQGTASKPLREITTYGQCSTPHKQISMCVKLSDCPDLYALAHKVPLSAKERSFIQESQCGYNKGTYFICCPDMLTETRIGKLLPKPGNCGSAFSDRVYNGDITEIDEHPWMALIGYEEDGRFVGHHCGGSLINQRYVLTAAHCIYDVKETWRPAYARLGEWDTSTTYDCQMDSRGYNDCAQPHRDIRIEKIISHEHYSLSTNKNDIALFRLKEVVQNTPFIQPICLPTALNLRMTDFEGQTLDIVGWGQTETGIKSNIKLKASIGVVPLSDCQRRYNQFSKNLSETQMCAGGVNGTDACKGDSGGPLLGVNKGHYFIAGIASYGTVCGSQGYPGVYTKVSEYINWIQENLEP